MRLEKRIRDLEARWKPDVVVLHFADGSTRELQGPRHFVLDLFVDLCSGREVSARQREHAELVWQSIDAEELGGARLTELLRLIAAPPATTEGLLDGA